MHGFLKFSLLLISVALLVSLLCVVAVAGDTSAAPERVLAPVLITTGAVPDLGGPPLAPPRMAPELALQAFQRHAARQINEPVSYSANTVIEAELPDTAQHGVFHLQRRFIAPKTLLFTPVKFVGDGFVKSNVIARLLQAEVDHASKGEGGRTAISDANYKFNYKGTDEIDGRVMYVFHAKPRGKRPGLFKGRIYLDANTGSLGRAEGTLVKTQSFFIKKVDFVQDYAELGDYTLPVHAHSVAKTRIVGRAVVEIANEGYELTPDSTSASAATGTSSNNQ
jgi:hypothetical protein